MKRIAVIIAGLAAIGLSFAVQPASATSVNHPGDLPNGYHLKTDICHNVDHNPVVVHVSIDSTKDEQETGHGLLTLDVETHGFVSFVPHVGTGGHEHDFILRVYIQHGNDDVNTYVSEGKCEAPEVTTTTTEPPVTTTTTEPPVVTTTTQPPVVTTTTEPPAVTTTTQAPPTVVTAPPATDTPAPAPVVETPAPVVPVSAPIDQLPHTGAASTLLAAIGALLLFSGVFSIAMGKLIKARVN